MFCVCVIFCLVEFHKNISQHKYKNRVKGNAVPHHTARCSITKLSRCRQSRSRCWFGKNTDTHLASSVKFYLKIDIRSIAQIPYSIIRTPSVIIYFPNIKLTTKSRKIFATSVGLHNLPLASLMWF